MIIPRHDTDQQCPDLHSAGQSLVNLQKIELVWAHASSILQRTIASRSLCIIIWKRLLEGISTNLSVKTDLCKPLAQDALGLTSQFWKYLRISRLQHLWLNYIPVQWCLDCATSTVKMNMPQDIWSHQQLEIYIGNQVVTYYVQEQNISFIP